MKYYVIADIHGRYDLLMKAEEEIAIDSEGFEDFKTIFLGDYIDRGPESNKVINYLKEISENNQDVICLQGNHEAMLVQTIREPLDPDWWLGNGGDTTFRSYGGVLLNNFDWYYGNLSYKGFDPHVIPPEHIDWMESLPLYYETPKHVFVHAGVPNNFSLEAQDPERLQWMLYQQSDPGWWNNKHVVHGHHQFADGPHEWAGRTDLDCFAWNTGRLVIGVFDDTQHKALKFIEVLGDDYDLEGRRNLNQRLHEDA